eukprot:1296297-Prymnesium_polylepis.1
MPRHQAFENFGNIPEAKRASFLPDDAHALTRSCVRSQSAGGRQRGRKAGLRSRCRRRARDRSKQWHGAARWLTTLRDPHVRRDWPGGPCARRSWRRLAASSRPNLIPAGRISRSIA